MSSSKKERTLKGPMKRFTNAPRRLKRVRKNFARLWKPQVTGYGKSIWMGLAQPIYHAGRDGHTALGWEMVSKQITVLGYRSTEDLLEPGYQAVFGGLVVEIRRQDHHTVESQVKSTF